MRNAQRKSGIVAAVAVAAVLGWAVSAEEPKPVASGTAGEGKPRLQDDIKVKPGKGLQGEPTLEWSKIIPNEKIVPGRKGTLASDLLLGLFKLKVRLENESTWRPAIAVRFKMGNGGEYTIEKQGGTYMWKACNASDLQQCDHDENCGGGYGVPPELMNNVTMVAMYGGSDEFKPIAELNLQGNKP